MTRPSCIVGMLGADTCGCIDLHDGDQHVHACEARAGGVVRAVDDVTTDGWAWTPEQKQRAWRLGSEIRLYPLAVGVVPQCTTLAEPADGWLKVPPAGWHLVEGFRRQQGTSPTFYDGDPDEAYFQWKGTTAWLRFDCVCGIACEVNGVEFMYAVACPKCLAVYACDPHVKFRRVEIQA